MTKLMQSEQTKEIDSILEKLYKVDFDSLAKHEKKGINKDLKKLQSFLCENIGKATKYRKKNPKWHLDDTILEYNRMLENTAAFLVDYFMVDCSNDKLAFKYVTIGSELDNPHCLLALSYMYAKGKYGVIANSKKARIYIERAVNAGGIDDVNFDVAKNAMLECERRAASMYSAALADRASGSGFLEILVGFSDWLNDYNETQNAKRALEKESERKGIVVEEQTTCGTQYIFYCKEDFGRTNGKRLKNYDPSSGTGILDSGEEVKKSDNSL